MQNSIGNRAGGRIITDRQVGSHIGFLDAIPGKRLPRSRTVIVQSIEPVTPTFPTLRRRRREWRGSDESRMSTLEADARSKGRVGARPLSSVGLKITSSEYKLSSEIKTNRKKEIHYE